MVKSASSILLLVTLRAVLQCLRISVSISRPESALALVCAFYQRISIPADPFHAVGRTGSGKSTLTLALLRCIYTDGEMHYAGIPTSSIDLNALRSNITIIPQVVRLDSADTRRQLTICQPELLADSLRKNLDMLGCHDETELHAALRSAGLFTLQSEAGKNRLTLDSQVTTGGRNLSIGQSQIIALA